MTTSVALPIVLSKAHVKSEDMKRSFGKGNGGNYVILLEEIKPWMKAKAVASALPWVSVLL